MAEGTWVGLDVHARKVVAGVLDGVSGELRSWQAPTLPLETVEWLRRLPAPVRVAYEAGPTEGVRASRDPLHGRRSVEDPAGER